MDIPVVIIHNGNQLYFQDCVEINALSNRVYLIGDDSNQSCQSNRTDHFLCDAFMTDELSRFRNCFSNYSGNPHAFEFNCFARMFYLKQFMLTHHLDRVFHLDSDCILLDNIGRLLSLCLPDVVARNGIAYSKNKSDNPWHMVGCVHNALLTLDFCEAFIQLCFDVYENRSKFHWVEPKIRWHIENKIGGGICDMTLYYLLFTNCLLEVVDLNDLVIVDGERCIFDHNINISYGYLGDDTFVMSRNVKKIIMESGKFYAFDKNGSAIRLLSIHFSGVEAKSLLRDAHKLIFGQTG